MNFTETLLCFMTITTGLYAGTYLWERSNLPRISLSSLIPSFITRRTFRETASYIGVKNLSTSLYLDIVKSNKLLASYPKTRAFFEISKKYSEMSVDDFVELEFTDVYKELQRAKINMATEFFDAPESFRVSANTGLVAQTVICHTILEVKSPFKYRLLLLLGKL